MFLSELHDIHVNGHVFVGGETIMFNIATNRYEIYDLGGKVVEIEGRIGLVETGLGTAEQDIDDLEDGTTVIPTYELKENKVTVFNTY